MHMVIPFNVCMSHILFCFLLILLVTYDMSSYQCGNSLKILFQICLQQFCLCVDNDGFGFSLQQVVQAENETPCPSPLALNKVCGKNYNNALARSFLLVSKQNLASYSVFVKSWGPVIL